MRFGVIVSNTDMAQKVCEIGKKEGHDIFPFVLEGLTEIKYESQYVDLFVRTFDLDAIIVRNPIGYAINIAIPVIVMHITRMDIIRAAQKIAPDKRIAFFYSSEDKEKYDYDIDELKTLSGRNFEFIPMESVAESYYYPSTMDYIENRVDSKVLDKCDAVISGIPALINYMHELGKETSMIQMDEFDLRCAFRNAENAARSRNIEMQNTKVTEMALDSTKFGFIILNEREIVMINELFCNLAGVSRKWAMGKDVVSLAKENVFLSKVLSVKGKQIIADDDMKYSVFQRQVQIEEGLGSIPMEMISVINVAQLQETEISVRKQLDKSGYVAEWTFDGVISESDSMKRVIQTAKRYANSEFPILITGESGTGKEVIAQSIHNSSSFEKGPFVALNCAALPEQLLESELFGYEEGSFTGAKKHGKCGVFEQSHGGTLFLDEVGELTLPLQAKLLRALQEKSIRRVGGDRIIPVKNRLICATNLDLEREVEEKRFRLDFYYRINVLQVSLPPLRDRREDVPLFISSFVQKYFDHPFIGKRLVQSLSDRFSNYNWYGNVRQLENQLKRFCVMYQDFDPKEETVEHFIDRIIPVSDSYKTIEVEMNHNMADEQDDTGHIILQQGTWKELEHQILQKTYVYCGENLQQVAKKLDLGYSTVLRKMKKYKETDSSNII